MTNTIQCYVSLTTNNLKNLLSNFNIPYHNKKEEEIWNINIKPIDKKTRNLSFIKGEEKFDRTIKYNYIKGIDNSTISINFFKSDSDKTGKLNENKSKYTYFFSDSIESNNNNSIKEFIIVRQDLRNNPFSKLFPGSILEKNQNKIADGEIKDYGYLTFIENSNRYNIIPPFAFTSKRKNKEIMIESILLGISIKIQQNTITNVPQQIKKNTMNNSPKKIKCMIVTHNSILRCFLYKITEHKDFLTTRFKNNVILKIIVNKDTSYLEMISEGNLDSKTETKLKNKEKENRIPKKKYFIKNNFRNYDTNLHTYWSILGCDLEIYIVRHGVAYHNIRPALTKHLVYDTSLVPSQNKLSDAIKEKIPYDIDYYFVSPLIRTRQTFMNFICNTRIFNTNIVILPCSREIGNAKGNCRQEKIKPFENRTLPSNKDKPNDNKKITWDWSFYDREKGKCSEGSNMVYEMIKYIFYHKIHSDISKTRKGIPCSSKEKNNTLGNNLTSL